MKEPVDHILRPRLPWRGENEPAITECGYDASKVKTLTRLEYLQRLKDMGQQRTAMFICITCSQTAGRYPTWDEDPRRALERELFWECGWSRGLDRHGVRLRDELTAVAALIEAHPEEFKTLMAEIEQRRNWLAMKAERDKASLTPGRKLL